MTIDKVFDGNRGMNVLAMGSGGLTSGKFLIDNQENYNYKVVALMTNRKKSKAFDYSEEFSIPLVYTNLKKFKEEWGWDQDHFESLDKIDAEKYKDLMRTDFEHYNVHKVQSELLAKGINIDLIFASGWMLVMYKPLLDAFPGKIFNVHPADLSVMKNGKPKYTGDDAVYDAISSGVKETYSSIHIMTEKVDEGPVVVISKPLEVEIHNQLINYPRAFQEELQKKSKSDIIRMYVDGENEFWEKGHQDKQKYACDNPAALKAVQLASEGALETQIRYNKLRLVNDISLMGE